MAFLPYGSGISSHILFYYRDSISSCIDVIHKVTSELFKGFEKLMTLHPLLEDNMQH